MKKYKSTPEVFEIDEQPFRLVTAPADKLENSLESIDSDVRALIYRLAAAEQHHSEQEQEFQNRNKALLLALIDVLDAFERVFTIIRKKQDQVNPQMEKWVGNFSTVRRLLENLIFEQGVRAIENLDDGFNPEWHKATDTVSDNSKADGAIAKVVLKGYVWRNTVLRKAEVVTVCNTGS